MVLQMVLQFLDCFQSGEDGYIDLLRLSSSWLLAIAVSPAPKGEFTLGNLFQMLGMLGMLEVYIYIYSLQLGGWRKCFMTTFGMKHIRLKLSEKKNIPLKLLRLQTCI